jgi:hypothetical protein
VWLHRSSTVTRNEFTIQITIDRHSQLINDLSDFPLQVPDTKDVLEKILMELEEIKKRESKMNKMHKAFIWVYHKWYGSKRV